MKKGFTLVELLAIITILGIILLIGTSSMSKVIKEQKENLYKEQISSFIDSAKLWANDNTSSLPSYGGNVKLLLGYLIDENYIKPNVKNPITDETFSNSDYICIFNINGNYVYEYNGEC